MTTENHLNSAISHVDEVAANDHNLSRKQWDALKKVRKLLLEIVIEEEQKATN